jgi:hypothetical protein
MAMASETIPRIPDQRVCLLSISVTGSCQIERYPGWLKDSMKTKKLDIKYELNAWLKPAYIQEDRSQCAGWSGSFRRIDLLDRQEIPLDPSGGVRSSLISAI